MGRQHRYFLLVTTTATTLTTTEHLLAQTVPAPLLAPCPNGKL